MDSPDHACRPGTPRNRVTCARLACPRTGKRRYRDHAEAVRGLHAATAARSMGCDQRRETRVYECLACRGWHLTSRTVSTEVAA